MCARNRWRPYHLGTTPRVRVPASVRADRQAVRAPSATRDWPPMKIATIPSCRVSATVLLDMLENIARERNLRDWTQGNFPEREGRSTWEPLKRTAKNLGFISEHGNHPTGLLVEYCDGDPRAQGPARDRL